MSKLIDETGNRYGRLVAVSRDTSRTDRAIYWLCKCDCGATKSVQGGALRSGSTRSCGCLSLESKRERKLILPTMDKRDKMQYLARRKFLRRKYGLEEQDYRVMMDNQRGLCPICGQSLDCGHHPAPSVDHDHSVEVMFVRALLCSNCNVGIGHLSDSIRRLLRAIWYIIKHRIRRYRNGICQKAQKG